MSKKKIKCNKCGENFIGNFNSKAEITCPECIRDYLCNPDRIRIFIDKTIEEIPYKLKKRDKPLSSDNGIRFMGRWKKVQDIITEMNEVEGIEFTLINKYLKNLFINFELEDKPREESQKGEKDGQKRENICNKWRRTSYGRRIKQSA